MSRDKMLPEIFSHLGKKTKSPFISSAFVALVVALISGFFPLRALSHMTSLGTLFAFMVVSFGVIYLRRKEPNLKRSFRCPAVYFTAPMAILSCGYLAYTLLIENGKYFAVWIILGLIIYFSYGYRKSPLK